MGDVPAETEFDSPGVVDLSAGPEEERRGGTDALPEPPPGEYLSDPEEAPGDEGVPVEPTPEQELEEPGEPPTVPETAPEDTPAPEIEETPEPEPDPAPPTEDTGKAKSPVRDYAVLEREQDDEDAYKVRAIVEAHNPEGALRAAYRLLYAENAPDSEVTFVVVPKSMWQPKPVRGRPKTNVAIDIG